MSTVLLGWLLLLPQQVNAAPPATASKSTQQFARAMLRAIQMVHAGHILAPDQHRQARWGIEGLYRTIKVPLPADIARRLQKPDKRTDRELLAVLEMARARLGERPDLAEEKDLQLALAALFAGLEPAAEPALRSSFTPSTERIVCGLRGFITYGVGLKLEPDKTTGMLRITTPIFNSPAHKAGLRAGDVITHIRVYPASEEHPMPHSQVHSTRGMSVERANELILGREGTRIWLTIIPADGSKKR